MLLVAGLAVLGGQVVDGQEPAARLPGAMSADEAVILTNGYAFLSQGDVFRAGDKAAEALALHPRSPAAFALSMEVSIAQAGALAGLDVYEQWVGGRAEEPTFLRRVAWVLLEEAAAGEDPRPRLEALDALAANGDPGASRLMTEAVADGRVAETRMMAARGDALAVRQLATAVEGVLPNLVGALEALGDSGRVEAVAAITGRLDDPRSEVRAAAAEALGKTAGPDAVPRLTGLLDDRNMYVRVKAAGALYRLGDSAGDQILRRLARDGSASERLMAARAMSSRPDGNWQTLVRGLTRASEPDVRLSAASLAAGFDPELAAVTYEELGRSGNPAVRDEAMRLLARELPDDLPRLRGLLRAPDPSTRLAAAASILAMTR